MRTIEHWAIDVVQIENKSQIPVETPKAMD